MNNFDNLEEFGRYLKALENPSTDCGKLFRLSNGEILECECDSYIDMWGDWEEPQEYPTLLSAHELFKLYTSNTSYIALCDVRNKLTPLKNLLALVQDGYVKLTNTQMFSDLLIHCDNSINYLSNHDNNINMVCNSCLSNNTFSVERKSDELLSITCSKCNCTMDVNVYFPPQEYHFEYLGVNEKKGVQYFMISSDEEINVYDDDLYDYLLSKLDRDKKEIRHIDIAFEGNINELNVLEADKYAIYYKDYKVFKNYQGFLSEAYDCPTSLDSIKSALGLNHKYLIICEITTVTSK